MGRRRGGPRVYVDVVARVVALTVEEAHDLASEINGCLSEIRWHVARWVIVSTWSRAKEHLVVRNEFDERATALCGYRPSNGDQWFNAWPVETLTSTPLRPCRRCLRRYHTAADELVPMQPAGAG